MINEVIYRIACSSDPVTISLKEREFRTLADQMSKLLPTIEYLGMSMTIGNHIIKIDKITIRMEDLETALRALLAAAGELRRQQKDLARLHRYPEKAKQMSASIKQASVKADNRAETLREHLEVAEGSDALVLAARSFYFTYQETRQAFWSWFGDKANHDAKLKMKSLDGKLDEHIKGTWAIVYGQTPVQKVWS